MSCRIRILVLTTVLLAPVKSRQSQMTARELFYSASSAEKSGKIAAANPPVPSRTSSELRSKPVDVRAIQLTVLKRVPGHGFQGR